MARSYHHLPGSHRFRISMDNNERRRLKRAGWTKLPVSRLPRRL